MELNTFRIFLIIIIILVALTLIILGIICLIKYIRKRKNNKKKEQQELSKNSTNETSQPSTNLSSTQNQNISSSQKYFAQKLKTREVKINAFCECFLKPVKFGLIKIYNESCPIDLIKFNENDLISVTKCHHGFHYNCIKKYLFENEKNEELKCPICLSTLFILDENVS